MRSSLRPRQHGTFSEISRRADFEWLYTTFVSNYAYLDREAKPWETWGVRYDDSVKRANTKVAYISVIASALDEIHDFHAEVRSHNPQRWLPVPTFSDVWAESNGLHAVVTAVRRGSDAEHAGIAIGDQVTALGKQPLDKAIAERLTSAACHSDSKARQWALLSLLAGRAD